MPSSIGENHTRTKLRAGELVLFMGVNQLRTPNIAMIAAARGFDGVYIDLEHNPASLETASATCERGRPSLMPMRSRRSTASTLSISAGPI